MLRLMLATSAVALASLGGALVATAPAQAMDVWFDSSHDYLTVAMDQGQVDLIEVDHPFWEWSVCGELDRAAVAVGKDLSAWDCEGWLPRCVQYVRTIDPQALPVLVFGPPDRDPHCDPS